MSKSALARFEDAVSDARAGRSEAALSALETLAAEGVTSAALSLQRALVLDELGRTEESETVLVTALATFPTDPGLHTAYAKALWRRGEHDAFTAAFEAAVEQRPDDAGLRLGCADILRRAGFLARAEALLRHGTHDDEPILSGALGVLLDEQDRTQEALPLLQRALTLAPERENARIALAHAYLRLGESEAAAALIAPMRVQKPTSQLWICLESMALRQSGDPRYHWLCDYERMIQSYELPVPVGHDSTAAFNVAFAKVLLSLHTGREHPLDKTLRNGTQSSQDLRNTDAPEVRAYFEALREPIAAYIGAMSDPEHPWSGRRSADFTFASAWSVRLRAGGYHVNHIHSAGWISSAYYVTLPDATQDAATRQGWIKFGEPPLAIPGCTVERVVEPRAGRLVLFPSYFWHGTIAFSRGERLTAPFDVAPA